jgi:citrate lyase subunit beta/citryl-CoA lyase
MSMTLRPRRSVLYTPGSNFRALEKAKTLKPDAFIFDLEDAVAPDSKAVARDKVVATVKGGGFGKRELIVRINGLGTPWGADDIAAAATVGPDAILVPKVSTPEDVMTAARALQKAGAPQKTRLWIMLETPLAMLDPGAIARTAVDTASRLAVAVVGTNDIAKDMRARLTPGRPSMLAYLSLCVAACRAHGVEILDGVYNDFSNEKELREECVQGRDFGMDGKTLIHPNQIGPCNEIFAPTAEEIVWAKRIIAVFDEPANASKGVVQVEGHMVERLHAEMARRTIAIADAIAALS